MDLENYHKKTEAEKLADIRQCFEDMRARYASMSNARARKWFEALGDDTLRSFCYDIGLPAENYEMCQMTKEVLESRGKELYDVNARFAAIRAACWAVLP